MPNTLDDVARILASSVPRREALKRVTCVLFGGGALSALAGCNDPLFGGNGCKDRHYKACAACAPGICCPPDYPWYCDGGCYANGCRAGTSCSTHCVG
jgi:hypothetical protein